MSYAQTIYNHLRRAGMTECGALAMLGNWQQESGCEPGRVQGDFDSFRRVSKQYVSDISVGKITRDQFARDQKGIGLAQWTWYERKYNLYDFWKKYGSGLDDVVMQTEFALSELKSPEYAQLWNHLCTGNDLFTLTSEVCRVYERPFYNNIDARFNSAKQLKAEIDLGQFESTEIVIGQESKPQKESEPVLRDLCKGMKGADVVALKALLRARGYTTGNINATFGKGLEDVVKSFQDANGLVKDGIVGNNTWGVLLKRW